MTDDLNDHLAAVLDIAAEQQETCTDLADDPASVVRYAVLRRVENDLALPALVKYGDAPALMQEMSIGESRVWGAVPGGGWTLFRIEWTSEPSANQRRLLNRTMQAIGAWRIGTAGIRGQPNWDHTLFAWPSDHPVTQMLPRPAEADETEEFDALGKALSDVPTKRGTDADRL